MTFLLESVVDELRTARGPIRWADLADRVGVPESALAGMIDVLVAKGRLSAAESTGAGESVTCSGGACSSSCVGADRCVFIATVPKSTAFTIASMSSPNSVRENGPLAQVFPLGRDDGARAASAAKP